MEGLTTYNWPPRATQQQQQPATGAVQAAMWPGAEAPEQLGQLPAQLPGMPVRPVTAVAPRISHVGRPARPATASTLVWEPHTLLPHGRVGQVLRSSLAGLPSRPMTPSQPYPSAYSPYPSRPVSPAMSVASAPPSATAHEYGQGVGVAGVGQQRPATAQPPGLGFGPGGTPWEAETPLEGYEQYTRCERDVWGVWGVGRFRAAGRFDLPDAALEASLACPVSPSLPCLPLPTP